MRRTLRLFEDCRGIEVWLALQGSSKNRLECQLSRFKESDRRSDAPSSSRSGFAFGAAPWPNEAWGTRALWGFARLHGSDTEISLHASGDHAPTSRSWAPGRGSNVGRVCVAVTLSLPQWDPLRFLDFHIRLLARPACCTPGIAYRCPFTPPPSSVSRLCARRPASILAIGRSSDWQPPRKRN